MNEYNELLIETINLEESYNNIMIDYEVLEEGYYFEKFKKFVVDIKDTVIESMISVFRKMKKVLFSLKNKGVDVESLSKKDYEVLSEPNWMFQFADYIVKTKAYKLAVGNERDIVILAKSGIGRMDKSVKQMIEDIKGDKVTAILNKSTHYDTVSLKDEAAYHKYIKNHIDVIGKGISKIEAITLNIEKAIERVNHNIHKMQKMVASDATRRFRHKKTEDMDSLLFSALVIYADMTKNLMSIMKKCIDRCNRSVAHYKNIIEPENKENEE